LTNHPAQQEHFCRLWRITRHAPAELLPVVLPQKYHDKTKKYTGGKETYEEQYEHNYDDEPYFSGKKHYKVPEIHFIARICALDPLLDQSCGHQSFFAGCGTSARRPQGSWF
jgi:hypothetical protein